MEIQDPPVDDPFWILRDAMEDAIGHSLIKMLDGLNAAREDNIFEPGNFSELHHHEELKAWCQILCDQAIFTALRTLYYRETERTREP